MKTYKPTKAGLTTLEVLEYVSSLSEPAAASDIAKKLNLPIGTLMCHLAALEERKFVQRVGGVLFEATSKLAQVWADRKQLLYRRQRVINQQLKEMGDETTV